MFYVILSGMSLVAVERFPIQVAESVEHARDLTRAMHTGSVGFVMDLSGVELSGGDPRRAMAVVGSLIGRTVSARGLNRSSYIDFGITDPSDSGFGLHIDGSPGRSRNMVDSVNCHVTFSGECDVDLVTTRSAFWEKGYSDVPKRMSDSFADGLIDYDLFGGVYSARVTGPALVVHQLSGLLPVAHRYRNVGSSPRHSAAVIYDRRVPAQSISALVRQLEDQ